MSKFPKRNSGCTPSRAHSFADDVEGPDGKRMMRKRELAWRIGCSESTVENRVNPKSPWYDESFPKPQPLGAGGSRSSAKGWRSDLVDAWIESRGEVPNKG
jgi:prophage regulatory protein